MSDARTRARPKWKRASVAARLLFVAVVLLWAGNHSSCGIAPQPRPKLLAHRGVHQSFALERVETETCTACMIRPPTHGLLENTLASMQAAFDLGADRVEFDVQLTRDDSFAVFHDYTLDCRTNGAGIVRDHTLAELQKLDIGWGYSADGGMTHPFRGRGIGLMPSLDDVLDSFPGRRLLVHLKRRDRVEAERLSQRLSQLAPNVLAQLIVYGADDAMAQLKRALPALRVMSRGTMITCGSRYVLAGWTGHVPEACRNTLVLVPNNYGWLLWGWPRRFQERIEAHGSELVVMDRVHGVSGGFDSAQDLRRLPVDYAATIWTNRVELVAPALPNE